MSDKRIYHRILDRAKEMVKDNQRIRDLLLKAGERLSKVGDGSEESKGFFAQLKLFIRMIRAHINGTYQGFSPMTLLMFVFVLVYFITPIDLIPDFVPALGFTDDITVALMVMKRFSEDIKRYREWEQAEIVQ